jgi:hypothetical protein
MRSTISILFFVIIQIHILNAQERVVKVDFQSNSFTGSPDLPFDQNFLIEGKVYKDVTYVEVLIFNDGSEKELLKYTWNRDIRNLSESFAIIVPGGLKSNSKYDFKISTYKMMSSTQKSSLLDNLQKRICFYLRNHYLYNGKDMVINNPNSVYSGLKDLLSNSLRYQISKNGIELKSPSKLVLDELKKNSDFKFNSFLHKTSNIEKDSIANLMLDKNVKNIADLIMTELQPFFNSDLMQFDRSADVKSVATEKERFSIPINLGMYAWNKPLTVNNNTVHNISFTPGVGLTIPFNNQFRMKNKTFDSFGFSMGVLLSPIRDANGTEFVTPGVKLPVYTGLGIRIFNVFRLNAGVLVVGEKGQQDFNSLKVLPTAGLAL